VSLADVDLARTRGRELGPLVGCELLAGRGPAGAVREEDPDVVHDHGAGAVADRRSRHHVGEAAGVSKANEVRDPAREDGGVGDDVRFQLRGGTPVDVEGERDGERDHHRGEQVGGREY
jgi:hypothetical protein